MIQVKIFKEYKSKDPKVCFSHCAQCLFYYLSALLFYQIKPLENGSFLVVLPNSNLSSFLVKFCSKVTFSKLLFC
jgi:hypothetical protein